MNNNTYTPNNKYDKYIKELDVKGYTVIPNIFSTRKCNKYIKRVWDWLEGLGTGIKRDDPSTWKNDKWPVNIHGIIQHLKVGHAQFVWDIRCEKKVIEVFEEIWKTKELLVSFDAVCIGRPPEKYGNWRNTSWAHTDQSEKKLAGIVYREW
jgi:hypothetical protein